jgi:hypothetical protein
MMTPDEEIRPLRSVVRHFPRYPWIVTQWLVLRAALAVVRGLRRFEKGGSHGNA